MRGDYGADANIEEWYVPVTGKYITEQYAFRITLPWVRLTAPAGTTLGDSQLITTGDGAPVTTQGVGDMVASVTRYDLLGTETVADVSLDLTGKVKFATADTGLGTGENDYTVQAALYKSWEQLRSYAIAGYTLRGEPPGIDLRDVWSGVAGGRYRFTAVFDAGLDVYYRQASLSSLSNQKELTALLGVRLDADQKLQFYVLHGLDDGSPDWGAGLMFTVTQ